MTIEYKFVSENIENKARFERAINELILEGWNVADLNFPRIITHDSEKPDKLFATLKRTVNPKN